MGNSHAPAPLLPVLLLLASGCAADKPANSADVVKEATKNANLHELAMKSERVIRVTVDAERRVFFGKEQVGTSYEVGPLEERVRQAIERNRQAARDEADEEAARQANTVFVCAPQDFKYGELARAVNAVEEAGGNPVGLRGCDPSAR